MIEDWPQDGIAVAKGVAVAIGDAQEALAIGRKTAAFDQAAFPGQGFDAIGPEDIWMGEVFAEVDAARPILRAGKGRRFNDAGAKAGLRQSDGGRHAGTAAADNYHIELRSAHLASFR